MRIGLFYQIQVPKPWTPSSEAQRIDALRTVPSNGAGPSPRAALMTAGYCHEDPLAVAQRGTELVGWYIEQQRERARLVWRL